MSDVINFNQASRVRDQASLWLVRLQEGLQGQQRQQLQEWVNADTAHGEQLLELATVWDDLGVLTELAPLFDDLPNHERDSAEPKTVEPGLTSRPRYGRWAMAASVVITSVLVLFFGSERNSGIDKLSPPLVLNAPAQNNIQAVHYQTALGEHSQVRLSDGSMVTLNSNSHIVVTIEERSRNIKLIEGEAHFAVYKDPSRPLSVFVNGKAVQAVGTAFSVRKGTDNKLVVAVDEGRVAVYRTPDANNGFGHLANGSLEASLIAGDVLTIVNDNQSIVQYDQTEMEDRLAWKNGMIVINDESLDFVIGEFARHSQKKILLADRQMGEIRVAGYFRLGDIDALMVALEQNFGIRSIYYKKDDTFVLSQL